MENSNSFLRNALSRRTFMAGAGTAAAGALLTGCSDNGTVTIPIPSVTAVTDADILNFALNLEYLEASFYLYATTGTGLSATDMGSGAGMVTGGAQVTNFSPTLANIAAQIAADELTHVELLRSALGSAAVAMPNINLGALGTVNNQTLFLQVARAFEDTGVSAYIGAAQYLVSSVPDLTYAAQILAIEAYHASNIRQNIIELGLTSAPTDSMDVPPITSAYFCETKGLAIVRTPQQVLNIVYANTATGVKLGGFFPNGLNGTIVST